MGKKKRTNSPTGICVLFWTKKLEVTGWTVPKPRRETGQNRGFSGVMLVFRECNSCEMSTTQFLLLWWVYWWKMQPAFRFVFCQKKGSTWWWSSTYSVERWPLQGSKDRYIDRIGTGTPSSFLKVTGWKLVCSQGLADRKHVCKHFGYFNDSHLALGAVWCGNVLLSAVWFIIFVGRSIIFLSIMVK